MTASRPKGALTLPECLTLLLFFSSGAAALVYEVAWTRELTNVFGGSAFAIATVLAAFMAGLALGSRVLGAAIDKKGHPLRVYALLELGIVAAAVLLPVIFRGLDAVYVAAHRQAAVDGPALDLLRFALSFLALLLPTTLMGGTLPVLGKLLLANPENLGARAGLLYGANTLGAVAGVAGGGFFLLPALGIQGATAVAMAINVLVALLAFVLARSLRIELPQPTTASATSANPFPVRVRRAAVLVYAASGFAALAYEVAWSKTLSMVLGTTTYAFTAMLTTFLLGLAIGSALFARLADRTPRPDLWLCVVQLGIPLTALAGVPLLGELPALFVAGFPSASGSWFGLELYRVALAGLVMILPTLLMGGTFPLVSRVVLDGRETGKRLGTLYAFNTVGAILGSFIAGFVLIPVVGRQATLLAASSVNLAAVFAFLAVISWRHTPMRWRVASATTLFAALVAFSVARTPWDARHMASGAYLYAPQYARAGSIDAVLAGDRLSYYDEAPEGTVSVWRRGYKSILRINGKVDASSHGDMITQKLLGHLPALYHPNPREGLVIGLGSGVSAGALLTHDLNHVETVDLMPRMHEAARLFDAVNGGCLDDPRHTVRVRDGRNHLKLTETRYDVIVSEPSNPWIAGIGSLFTREFFSMASERLAPGGVLCQWIQFYEFHEDDLKTVLATVHDVFPHVHVWLGAPGDLIVLASETPLALESDRVAAALAGRAGEDLEALEILPVSQLIAHFLTDENGLGSLVSGWPGRVTDDNLYLEFAVPRHMFAEEGRVRLGLFDPHLRSPRALLAGFDDPRDLLAESAAFRSARALAFQAHYENRLPMGVPTVADALARAHGLEPRERLARTLVAEQLLRDAVDAMAADDPRAEAFLARVETLGLREHRATACLYRGSLAFAAGHTDSAEALWRGVLELEPEFAQAWVYLGGAAESRGERDAALAAYRKARDLHPEGLEAWTRAASIHAATGDWNAAGMLLAEARALDPTHPKLRELEGVLWLQTGEARRAAKRFAELAASEASPEVLYNLAVAREEVRAFPEAAEAWRSYLARHPEDPRALAALAWILATELGAPAEAEPLARQAVTLAATANHLDTLAETLFRLGRHAEALKLAREAVELENSDYYRGQLARFQGAGLAQR